MRLTIGKKLLAGFAVLLVLMGTVGAMALLQINGLNRMLEDMYTNQTLGISTIKEANVDLVARGRAEKNMILAEDSAEIQKHAASMEDFAQDLQRQLDAFEPLIKTEAGRTELRHIRDAWAEFVPIQEQIKALALRRQVAEARAVAAKGRLLEDRIDAAIDELVKQKEAMAKAKSQEGHAVYFHANLLVAGLLLLALALGLGIGLFLSRQISRGLAVVSRAAEGIARGELDQQVEVRTNDELGDMAGSFRQMMAYLKEVAGVATALSQGDLTQNVQPKSDRDQFGTAIAQMIQNLRSIVQRVRSASDTVGAGAQQIASSSTELAKTVSVQASSAEETSAAMEEMAANIQSVDKNAQDLGTKVTLVRTQSDELAAAVTQTSSSISELAASVQQVAGNVGHASHVAEQASEAANVGDQAVAKSTEGMGAIAETMSAIQQTIRLLDERSGEIGAIIEVIDDIAEQTNLLALNAAIEAARAGEAGRGFAVVADEVRKLAERSAKATGEIGTLIQGIQKETAQAVGVTREGSRKVQEGVQLASHTGEALHRIKDAAAQVTTLLSEVAAATGEQARASQQIVVASEQMAGINHKVTGAVSEMDQLTRSVTYATAEQRQGTDQVVIAVESLSRSSQEASAATEQVSTAADSLSEQARLLQEAVAFFHLEAEARQIEVRIGSGKPLAIPARL
ncbi:MAG TPA: methyl-accepting chemotaxis protein [Stenomitos sp.]